MAVSASVSSVCSVAATPLAFGEVALSGATPGTATVTVNCTGGGAYTVGLGNGLHNIAAARFLQSGVNTLAYDLFKEVGYANRWATRAPRCFGTIDVDQALTVYGRSRPTDLARATARRTPTPSRHSDLLRPGANGDDDIETGHGGAASAGLLFSSAATATSSRSRRFRSVSPTAKRPRRSQ